MSESAAVDFISVVMAFTITDDEPEGNAVLAAEIDELIRGAEKGLKDSAVIKAIAAHQRTDAVTKAGLYKALSAAQKAAEAPAEKPAGKKTPAKKGDKKAKKEKKPAKPKTTREDGFALKKAECAEQNIVAPIGVLWQRGCAMYKLHGFLAEGNVGDGEPTYRTVEEVKGHLPELKSVMRYIKECEGKSKIGPGGWDFERVKGEGDEADKIRIFPNTSEYTIAEGCNLLD